MTQPSRMLVARDFKQKLRRIFSWTPCKKPAEYFVSLNLGIRFFKTIKVFVKKKRKSKIISQINNKMSTRSAIFLQLSLTSRAETLIGARAKQLLKNAKPKIQLTSIKFNSSSTFNPLLLLQSLLALLLHQPHHLHHKHLKSFSSEPRVNTSKEIYHFGS